MKVLFVAWEMDPFFKVGGLGDVSRSLPQALQMKGIEIRVAIPFYKVLKFGRTRRKKLLDFLVDYAGKKEKVTIYQVTNPISKVITFLYQQKKYLDRVNDDTFAFFDQVIVESIRQKVLPFEPEIIHSNDSHCGFIPLLIKVNKMPQKNILTIHNLAYHGSKSPNVIEKLGLNHNVCRVVKWEIESKRIKFLMEGIIHSDIVCTVSPTYAKEIMTEEYGAGLNEILKGKEGKVFGILNGIDLSYNVEMHNKALRYHYIPNDLLTEGLGKGKIYTVKEGKKLNKLFLQRKLGLKENSNIPLFGFVGRIDPAQKGIDLIHRVIRRRTKENYQLVLLGTGNVEWEERFSWLSSFYPKSVSCNFKFDEALARQIYAGSDFLLVPSKYEPCGLIQMIAMFYGTLPIVRKTGGLADSVKDGINGFVFNKYSSEELEKTMIRAMKIWSKEKESYWNMVDNAMKTDFSWDKSAEEYVKLYGRVTSDK